MIVELISVGTDVLMGNVENTNAYYLARKCTYLGFDVDYHLTIGENRVHLSNAIKEAFHRSDIIIVIGESIYDQKEVILNIETKNIWNVKEFVDEATVLENKITSGLYIYNKEKHIFLLPNQKIERYAMFEKEVENIRMSQNSDRMTSVMVKMSGIDKSMAQDRMKDIIEAHTNLAFVFFEPLGEVHLRITEKTAKEEGKTKEDSILNEVDSALSEVKKRFSKHIYTQDEMVRLEEHVIKELLAKKYTLTAAESCTGGLFLGKLINVSGASTIIQEGFVTYAEDAKIKNLGVLRETIDKHGVVSEEVAAEMAFGAALRADANVGIGITGTAGPTGGTKEKPVGTVCIGCAINGVITTNKYLFSGNREVVREKSVQYALDLLRRCLLAQ